MELQIIPWNVDPEIFRIGNFAVRWYGLLFASGFVIGYYIMKKIFKNEGFGDATLDRLTVYVAIGTIVGARLGHCLFYEPAYYLARPLEILKIWHGGLASHGAAIGIPLALWLFARKERKPFIWAIDRVVIVVALAGVLIRLGNLMNSEIYGVETTLPWGFVFLRNGETAPKHPTQIYEALAYLITFGVLMRIYWKNMGKQKPGLLFGVFLIMVFGFRFFVEYVKEDQVAFEAGMKLNMGQWLSIPLVLIGIAILIWAYRHKPVPVTKTPSDPTAKGKPGKI
ncbi:MAG TPA: prolipoprotein diacylglyceryl transferase [Bacteroidales bacterium]|nr:prolipoprotein diacylglyceryl transferase [Bacteroidales bacterium]HOO67627.1 prolipoprotein diacylglyceryl transferase [Bacteroidales bacterium]HPE23014.1 prolipoprotein diacylglyceryl transferase [Bacteroidales bacterium]HPJ06236.1 prolipoprotein diacylglyceryl transferase [Bacteroidales bacterium]HPQ64433.1 prolipoprotein diacylglyceryl transferase [Bacteroidales bacterium]